MNAISTGPRPGGATAVILITLPPELEARRKRFGRHSSSTAIFDPLPWQLQSTCAGVDGRDLFVAAPQFARLPFGRSLRQRGRALGESLRHAFRERDA